MRYKRRIFKVHENGAKFVKLDKLYDDDDGVIISTALISCTRSIK